MQSQTRDFLVQHHSRGIEYYRRVDIPEKYRAEHWITDEASVSVAFARYIETLLGEVDSGRLSYAHILKFSRGFYHDCIHDHRFLLREIQKLDPVFDTLLIDCMLSADEIGQPDCNTDRQTIDLLLGLILNAEAVYAEFEQLAQCSWSHLCVSWVCRHESIADYLLRSLNYEDNAEFLESVIDCLAYQRADGLLPDIDTYLYPESLSGYSAREDRLRIQQCAINYLKHLDHEDARRHLIDLRSSGSALHENHAELAAALRKHTGGEAGLLDLYAEAEDWELRYAVADCYALYGTKSFAQLLLKALRDDTVLADGHYPLRRLAHQLLVNESYAKLIEWFGFGAIARIDSAVLESE